MGLKKQWVIRTSLFTLWLLFCGQIYFPSAVCPSPSLARIIDSLLYVVIPVLAVVVAFRITRTFSFNKKSYIFITRLLGIPLIVLLFCVSSFSSNMFFRKLSWKQMVHKGTPIIAEIEKYKAKNTNYPGELDEIGIEDVSTGVCSFDKFRYRILEDGGYELSVFMPEIGLNFSELVYWSSKDYSSIHDLTRVGDWAFIHE